MPGQPVRALALPIFPRQFTLENCQSAAGYTVIVVRQAVRITTYSLNPLSGRMLRPATEKHFPCAETVDDETSLWMPEEIRKGIAAREMSASTFQ